MADLDAEILSPLSNRYRIVSQLGDGGFGKTFLVEDMQMPSNRRCVLKQLKPVNDNPQIHQMVQERFQREAAILERLGEHHTQIPRLYAYFSEGEKFYLVEEWIEGDTLAQRVHQHGVLSEAAVRTLLAGLLPTIADIHQQGIVHRDIKPDNIILRRSDNKPVLIDFGAVKETMSTMVNSQGDSTQRPVEPQQPVEPPRKPSSSVTDSANATIVGEAGSKNIRTGPGTQFSTQHIAYPGDRVRIIGSSRDEGGYTWYRVYFPKSGADGWIAGQLLNLD